MGKYNDFVQASEEEIRNMQKAYSLAENKNNMYDENFNITNNNVEICDNMSANNNGLQKANNSLQNDIENNNENNSEQNNQNLKREEAERQDNQSKNGNNKQDEQKEIEKKDTGNDIIIPKGDKTKERATSILNFLLLLAIIDLKSSR